MTAKKNAKAGAGDKRSVSTDALETLGTKLKEGEKRDAIHIAVEPVIAAEKLWPGARITILDGKAFNATKQGALGIVDPFLEDPVEAGERFWFLMMPRQVRSLRHVWSHPNFPDEPVAGTQPPAPAEGKGKEFSELWLREFCETVDAPAYDVLLRAATGQSLPTDDWNAEAATNDGDLLHFNGRDAHGNIPPEFWDHVEIVTGIKVPPEKRAGGFSCSC